MDQTGARNAQTVGKKYSEILTKENQGGGPDGWDVNHEPKVKDRDYDGKTRPEQIDDYQTGTDLKCRSCNRKDNK
jgi:hypothetical protein